MLDSACFENILTTDVPDISDKKIIIWGIGHTALLYLKGLDRIDKFSVEGFCANNADKKNFGGYRVFAPDELLNREDIFVFICSWQKNVVDEVGKQLRQMGIPYMNLDEVIFKLYHNDIISCYNSLSDDRSKQVYSHMIMSRMNNTMPDYEYFDNNTYFLLPAFKRYGNEVFVDCGAYTGDTVERYIWEKTSFKKIIALEPDKGNFNAMQKRVARLKDEWNLDDDKIVLYNYGVGSESSVLSFKSTGDMGAMFVPDDSDDRDKDEDSISIVALDDIIDERIDLLIADVESYEYDMLLGAKKLIKKYKPSIAVCIYHNAIDMFSIQNLLSSYVPEYKFAIRHGSVTFDETVLYAYVSDSIGWVK